MAEFSNLYVRLTADLSGFSGKMAAAAAQVRAFGDQVEDYASKNKHSMHEAGEVVAGTGAAIAVGLGLATAAAIQWESAWTGVTKTVDGTDEQMAQLEEDLRGLATTLPATHTEIAGVAEAAGALGVAEEDVASFTKTMIDLGETTNLTAEDAATSLARFSNIMGTPTSEVDRLGSSLVALGNSTAATEDEIMEMGLRISGAGAQIGMTEGDVMGFAAALSSVGVKAEMGGSAISRVFIDIDQAVAESGEKLDGFAQVSGMSSQQFVEAWEQDAAMATVAFIEGLGRMNDAGENTFGVLDELELSEVQVRDALLRASSAGDLFRTSLEEGNEAYAQNNALNEEAAKRYETTAAQMKVAWNQVKDLAIDLGAVLAPAIGNIAEFAGDVAGLIQSMPGPVQEGVAVLGAAAAATLLVGGALLLLAPKIVATKVLLKDLGVTAAATSTALKGLSVAGTVALGLYAAGNAIDWLVDKTQPAPPKVDELTNSLYRLADSGQVTGELLRLFGNDLGGLEDSFKRITDPSLMDRINDIGATTIFNGTKGTGDLQRAKEDWTAIDEALTNMASTDYEASVAAYESIVRWLGLEGDEVDKLNSLLPDYMTASEAAERQNRKTAEAAAATKDPLAAQAEGMGQSAEEAQAYADELRELAKVYESFIDPLDAYEAALERKAEAEEQSVEDTKITVDEYLDELERQVRAQKDWETNMLLLSSRVSQGTLDELAAMGPEGADLVAQLVDASDEELDRLDDAFREDTQAATEAMADTLKQAGPVLEAVAAEDGQATADAYARELAAGTTTVEAIAAKYGIALTSNIPKNIWTTVGLKGYDATIDKIKWLDGYLDNIDGRVVYVDVVGRGKIPQGNQADGSVLRFYGDGEHVAQIAPAGAWRVWAEPETGGEAYIPLAPGKRGRSTAILQEVATDFGYALVPREAVRYADGGRAVNLPVPASGSARGGDGAAQPLIGSLTIVTQASSSEDVASEVMYAVRKARRGGRGSR